MAKQKNENQLIKLALQVGSTYAKNRGYKDFGKGVSPKIKLSASTDY